MGYFENFQKRMSLGGNSLREKRIYNSRILVNQTFCEDLSYVPDVYKWELGLTSYEDRKPYHTKNMDWVANRIAWAWKWRKITKEEMEELADRATAIFDNNLFID